MQEKDMVLDILTGVKASVGSYAKIITETGNLALRQKYQQMRDADEKFQYDLYKIADQKGYYHTAPNANPEDMQMVKQSLSATQPQIMTIELNAKPKIPGL